MIKKGLDLRYAIPKEKWEEGPWQQEPDDLIFEYRNHECVLKRNRVGAWCGYVAVDAKSQVETLTAKAKDRGILI